jgi:uridylate kinase
MEESFILKIGGSVLYDNNLDVNFDLLKKLKTWYYENKGKYEKIVIVTGGGNLSRDLQKKIAGAIGGEDYLNNIAMSVTQTNAAMIQGYLEDPDAYIPKRLGDAYEYLEGEGAKVLISGGLKVGWSTDMDAAIYADMLDTNKVSKISDIDHVYDSDPDINPKAQLFKDLTWEEYFHLFNIFEGENHEANENIPIDVICAQFCSKKGISFFISGGKHLTERSSIEEILKEGTNIH